MNKMLPKKILISLAIIFNVNAFSQGLDFGAYARGAEEANRRNQEDYEYSRRVQKNQQQEESRRNLINQYKLKFNETNDFRYLFIASEMGDVEASRFIISSGIFCSRHNGIITCSR